MTRACRQRARRKNQIEVVCVWLRVASTQVNGDNIHYRNFYYKISVMADEKRTVVAAATADIESTYKFTRGSPRYLWYAVYT